MRRWAQGKLLLLPQQREPLQPGRWSTAARVPVSGIEAGGEVEASADSGFRGGLMAHGEAVGDCNFLSKSFVFFSFSSTFLKFVATVFFSVSLCNNHNHHFKINIE
jgi:hypothetical protein